MGEAQFVVKEKAKAYWALNNWIWIFSIVWIVLIGLPFMAPLLMKLGLTRMALGIYWFYSFLCHQLPQRSYFMFGNKSMYSLIEVGEVIGFTNNPLILRDFIGNTEMGWKVAWSDRMVMMYSAILPASWLWYLFRDKLKSLSIFGLILFFLPMGIDGITHMISDFSGIGLGFRYHNLWLAELTNYIFAPDFYYGDAMGSFNSIMRIMSGILFAIGAVWFGFPALEESFSYSARRLLKKNIEIARLNDEIKNIVHQSNSN